MALRPRLLAGVARWRATCSGRGPLLASLAQGGRDTVRGTGLQPAPVALWNSLSLTGRRATTRPDRCAISVPLSASVRCPAQRSGFTCPGRPGEEHRAMDELDDTVRESLAESNENLTGSGQRVRDAGVESRRPGHAREHLRTIHTISQYLRLPRFSRSEKVTHAWREPARSCATATSARNQERTTALLQMVDAAQGAMPAAIEHRQRRRPELPGTHRTPG